MFNFLRVLTVHQYTVLGIEGPRMIKQEPYCIRSKSAELFHRQLSFIAAVTQL